MATQEEPLRLISTKEPFREPDKPRKIKRIQFGLQSQSEIVDYGEFHVHERGLYQMPERKPLPNGVLDTRLGVSSKQLVCATCSNKLADCAGHFGYMKLELPVFHIGYFKHIVVILQSICKTCAAVMLPELERQQFLRKFRNPNMERLHRQKLAKKLSDRCKRLKICPSCGAYNGTVKKITGTLKIIHDKYSKNLALWDTYLEEFEEVQRFNQEIGSHLTEKKVTDDLNPIRVLSLFEKISPEDVELLCLDCRPEDLIMTHIAVPPVCIRPSVEMDAGAGSNEDDITMKLMQIMEVNNVIRKGLEEGLTISNLMENWDFLQVQCAMYINSDLPGLPPTYQVSGKPLRGFVQRLKGKQGRFRGNLSGKRVDFSGRTVISPDPNISIDEVCVPVHVATTLTFPDRVTSHNIERLRKCVINGLTTHPGAWFVLYPDGGKLFLKYGDRKRIAAELKVGDIVERHLCNGDIVLFNRQPSLHRMSIMAHKARVMPWRTFRFNECVCNPYNADFDGDEMNLHVPQTEEAKAEAYSLMGVVNNLSTPKNGEILVAATQDFLTSAFLITSKDKFFNRAEFSLYVASFGDALNTIDLPTPALLKPVEMWTGKQLFSVLVRPNVKTRVFVNLETTEKTYTKQGKEMCPADGYVVFRNSDLICGRLGKSTLGNGNKAGLFSTLAADFSPKVSAVCMNRLAKLSARFIGNQGFSIGIDDVTPAEKLRIAKEHTVNMGYADAHAFIKQYNEGALQLQPGCNMEQTLEAQVTGVLNKIREQAGKVCMDTLDKHNSPLIMSQCGSKGSPINIAQMVACVGQQSVGGKRAPNGFRDRTLPHFPRHDKTPQGKGFVANSFYSGLTPTEFFFHTMGGREGLVDTAVKTAETGYMSRRLMKALEDLYVHYDMTVRNSSSGIVQFDYGDDGMDPVAMEGKNSASLDLGRLEYRVKAMLHRSWPAPGEEPAVMLPGDMREAVAAQVSTSELAHPGFCSQAFRDTVHAFLDKMVEGYEEARGRCGLPSDTRGPLEVEELAGQSGMTDEEVRVFIKECITRYRQKRVDPGSTVGAFGAQSIGEPGTQMTLKTFHFAGVASMNVTLGVPRIKEIINAAKSISTPIMKVSLALNKDPKVARIVKGRLEKTTLGQVANDIRLVFHPGAAYISVVLDTKVIHALQLDIDSQTVAQSILAHPRTKLKLEHVQTAGPHSLLVFPHETRPDRLFFCLQQLRQTIPRVIVQGIPTVERAVINDCGNGEYNLLVEGTDLQRVMATAGVLGTETTTNHVMECERTLGIEAARTSIMSEIKYTMGSHGMSIDERHTMLLADCMTYKGEVLGITRFGISKMKDSVLMLASFEKTTDHLFEAAIRGSVDDIEGVSESIIMGIPMPTGTGLFKLRHTYDGDAADSPTERPLPVLSY